MHRMCEERRPEDLQEQVQFPAARVPLPRGSSAQGVSLPGMRQGILASGQDEEPHENRARLFYAQGLRYALRLLFAWWALAGGARARWAADRPGGGSEACEEARSCRCDIQKRGSDGQSDGL